VVKGAKYPSGTKRKAAGPVLTHLPGGAGDRVGSGLLDASGSEKLTVTLVLKAASAVPGVGETDVTVRGTVGAVVVVDGWEVPCDVPPAPEAVREWLPRCRAMAVPTPPRTTTSTRPVTVAGARQRCPR